MPEDIEKTAQPQAIASEQSQQTAPESTADELADAPALDDLPVLSPVELTGQTVCSGTIFGRAQLLTEGELEVPHFTIEKNQTRAEFTRLRGAINRVAREFQELLDADIDHEMPAEARGFIELHSQILKDETLIADTQNIIRERLINAEWALAIRLEDLRRSFEEIDDDYLAERIEDIAQVIERVQRVLTGRRRRCDSVQQVMSESAVILIAEDLSPADILILRRRGDISIAGLIVELGSPTSHSAILARSLEIPMLVNVDHAREYIRNDDEVLLNADAGTVIVHPSEDSIPAKARIARGGASKRKRLQRLRSAPCATADGVRIELLANIALAEDVPEAVKNGADGIGLFRSEFLFMNRPVLPDEEEQFETYLRVIRSMNGKPVTIRTMDLGGDKQLSDEALRTLNEDTEEMVTNPALGKRAIRFCVDHPDIFKTQLRAILRASAEGDVRILLPMLTRLSEVHFTRRMLEQCRQELDARGQKYAPSIPMGGMIEVPAVAYCLNNFLRVLDFASIGTNDLVQYVLAADRQDPAVSNLCTPMHPAMIHMLADIIAVTSKSGKSVSVCGEAASDPLFAKLLIGLGIRSLSMGCTSLLAVKELMLSYTLAQAQEFARHIRRARCAQDLRKAVLKCCDAERELPLSPLMRSVLSADFMGLNTLEYDSHV